MARESMMTDARMVDLVREVVSALHIKPALIVVDMQKDFADDGALPVKGTYDIVKTINDGINHYVTWGFPIYFTRDWHPEQTSHFDEWPVHCVAHTEGAEFVEGLHFGGPRRKIVSKGMDPTYNGYSGFDGFVDGEGVSLAQALHDEGVTDLMLVGVATDYCVKHTALDGIKNGFNVTVLLDGTAAVNLKPEDEEAAVAEMVKAGVEVRERGTRQPGTNTA